MLLGCSFCCVFCYFVVCFLLFFCLFSVCTVFACSLISLFCVKHYILCVVGLVTLDPSHKSTLSMILLKIVSEMHFPAMDRTTLWSVCWETDAHMTSRWWATILDTAGYCWLSARKVKDHHGKSVLPVDGNSKQVANESMPWTSRNSAIAVAGVVLSQHLTTTAQKGRKDQRLLKSSSTTTTTTTTTLSATFLNPALIMTRSSLNRKQLAIWTYGLYDAMRINILGIKRFLSSTPSVQVIGTYSVKATRKFQKISGGILCSLWFILHCGYAPTAWKARA